MKQTIRTAVAIGLALALTFSTMGTAEAWPRYQVYSGGLNDSGRMTDRDGNCLFLSVGAWQKQDEYMPYVFSTTWSRHDYTSGTGTFHDCTYDTGGPYSRPKLASDVDIIKYDTSGGKTGLAAFSLCTNGTWERIYDGATQVHKSYGKTTKPRCGTGYYAANGYGMVEMPNADLHMGGRFSGFLPWVNNGGGGGSW